MRAVVWAAVAVVAALSVLAVPGADARLALDVERVASGPVYDLGPPPSNETEGNETAPPDPAPDAPVEDSDFCVMSSDVGWYCTTVPMPDDNATPPPPPLPDPVPDAAESPPAERSTAGDEGPWQPATSASAGQVHGGPVAVSLDDGSDPQGPAETAATAPPPVSLPEDDAGVATDPPGPSDAGASTAARVAAGGPVWLAVALAVPWALGLKALSVLALRRGAARASLRGTVLALVAAEPGVRHAELVRRIGRGNGTVEHHVRALIADGSLARLREGGSTGYYPAAMEPEQARLRLALQGATARRLAEAVAGQPGLRLVEAARRVGVSPPTAHYHLRRLLAAGVLRAAGGRFDVAPQASPLLAPVAGASAARFALERTRIAELAQDTPV